MYALKMKAWSDVVDVRCTRLPCDKRGRAPCVCVLKVRQAKLTSVLGSFTFQYQSRVASARARLLCAPPSRPRRSPPTPGAITHCAPFRSPPFVPPVCFRGRVDGCGGAIVRICVTRRFRDDRAASGAVRAGDEAAHQELQPGLRAAVLGGGDDASHVLPSSGGVCVLMAPDQFR